MGAESAAAISPTERNWTRPESEKSDQQEAKILQFPDKSKEKSENQQNSMESSKKDFSLEANKERTETPTTETTLPKENTQIENFPAEQAEKSRIGQITGKLKEVAHTEEIGNKIELLWNQAKESQKLLGAAMRFMERHRTLTGVSVALAIVQLEAIANIPLPPELMSRLTVAASAASAGGISSHENRGKEMLKGMAIGMAGYEGLHHSGAEKYIETGVGGALHVKALGKTLSSLLDDLAFLLTIKKKVK